jgi:hypothetical protein
MMSFRGQASWAKMTSPRGKPGMPPIDIEGVKIDCSSLFILPATSAAQNRLLFLLRPFTVLMKKTRAVKQSIIFRCL